MAIETKKLAKSITPSSSDDGLVGGVEQWPGQARVFYNDVRTEMKKVTSPSWKEVHATTAVVIITVFLFGLYFFIVDNAIGKSIDWLLRTLSHRG